jgi:hypothetical protein
LYPVREENEMQNTSLRRGLGFVALGILLPLAVPCTADEPQEQDRPKGRPAKEEKVDPAVQAWVEELGKHFADKNRTIRYSARAGLLEAGRPALPVLRKYAAGEDDAADIARMMITRIERGGRFGRMAAMPFGPRFGPGPRMPFPPRPKGPIPKEGKKQPDKATKKEPDKSSQKAPAKEAKKSAPQPRPPRGGRGGAGAVGRIVRDLNLDDKQKAKVDEVLADHQKKARELFRKIRSRELDRAKAREAFQELMQGLQKDLKGVLTEEQMKKVEEALKQLPRRGPNRRGREQLPEATPAKPARPGADTPAKEKKE